MPLVRSDFISGKSADFGQLPVASLICAFALLASVALSRGSAQGTAPPAKGDRPLAVLPVVDRGVRPSGEALREGSDLTDVPGTFKTIGERWIFSLSENKRQLTVLENLNLERVSREMADHPASQQWSISGTITEYHGGNYVLIRRAILRSAGEMPLNAQAPGTVRR